MEVITQTNRTMLFEEINPEKKEKYDVDMVIHFFQISPEEDA